MKNMKNHGFTLPELLISGIIITFLLSVVAYGFSTIQKSSKKNEIELERRSEIARALDFIASEVRQAQVVETNTDNTKNYFDGAGRSVVLALKIPGFPDDRRVVYYAAGSASPLVGPQAIYRWGPQLNSNGSYTDPQDPANWQSLPLIDRIDDTAIDSNWRCPSGTGNLSPSSGATGFYACVNGGVVQLYLNGQLQDDMFQGSTSIATRVNPEPPSPTVVPTLVSQAPPCNMQEFKTNGSCSNPVRAKFKVLGGTYACNDSINWNVKTFVEIRKSSGNVSRVELDTNGSEKELIIYPGDRVKLISDPDTPSPEQCKNPRKDVDFTDSEDSFQVRQLIDRDLVPDVAGLSKQISVKGIVSSYIQNNRIRLDNNQSIYLFELGQTNQDNNGFDLQDNVVLVTLHEANDTDSTDGGDEEIDYYNH
jgi:type II secretory pathway pseudopilin PulG